MADSIIASIDATGVQLNVKHMQLAIDGGVPRSLMDTAMELLRLSQFEVPHDEGTLQNSGAVEVVEGNIVLGYHTPYAARLHEHPEYHFQAGRKGKYLEDPIVQNTGVLNLRFGASFQQELNHGL